MRLFRACLLAGSAGLLTWLAMRRQWVQAPLPLGEDPRRVEYRYLDTDTTS